MILFKVGREFLIKVIAKSIPTSVMSMLRFHLLSIISYDPLLFSFGGIKRLVKGKFIWLLGKTCVVLEGMVVWDFRMSNCLIRLSW